MGNPGMQQAMSGMNFDNKKAESSQNTGGFDMSLVTELMKPETLAKLRGHPRIQNMMIDEELGPVLNDVLANPMSVLK